MRGMADVFKIGQASRLIGRDPETLRRWDGEGIFPARRDQRGYRVYTQQDVEELRSIRATRRPGPRKRP
jgi:DNA-binding transcriptional MerR regulator